MLTEGTKSKELLCPAKVNLFLKVGATRPDGYHELVSLMQPVSLYDRIRLSLDRGDSIEVRCTGAELPAGSGNLAYRAAELFFEATGIRAALSIDIDKAIPLGAGLGGGSSDAAGVLKGLNELFSSPLSMDRLVELAAKCGSDVPFFLAGGAAIVRGRGERVEKFELPEYYYILVNPGFQVSTEEVYRIFDLTEGSKSINLNSLQVSIRSPEEILKYLANDLERAVLERYPEVGYLKEVLLESGADGAVMSGSGPTVFGLFFDATRVESALKEVVETVPPSMRVFSVRGIKDN